MSSPFPSKLRGLLLALPFVFIAMAIGGDAAGLLPESRSYAFELLVILFLTSPHGLLTLPMFRLPEVRDMIAERTRNRTWMFWTPAMLAFAAGFGLFILAQNSMPGIDGSVVFSRLLLELLAYHHGIKQILGVSLIYNSRLRKERQLSEGDLTALARSEKIERWFFHFFIPSFLLFRTFSTLAHVESLPTLQAISLTYVDLARWATFALAMALIANTAWTVFGSTRDYEKLVYYGRLLLFVGATLGLPVVFMNGAFLAMHATEYMGLYGTIQENSRTTKKHKAWLYASVAAIFAMLLPLVYLNHAVANDVALGAVIASWIPVLRIMAAVEGGLACLHYYSDRQIFRARIPEVRKHVLPLFFKQAS